MEVLSSSSLVMESAPSMASLMQDLQRALTLEAKFQPRLQLPTGNSNGGETGGEITSQMRDGAAHVLRCLKVWYDLPSSVLLAALNLMDRFISRMKARPKHLSCIAISSFHLAALQWVERVNSINNTGNHNENTASTSSTLQAPEPQDLVMISQCKCTAGDIVRMEKIVESKLACLPTEEPVTTLTFLTLYHSLLSTASTTDLKVPDLLILSNKLETICCDANYAAFPSSQLALALLFTEVKRHNVLLELQQLLQVRDDQLNECMKMVNAVVTPYDGYAQSHPSHRQRLTWKLSRRTLKQLRPTEKLVSVLPTIEEHRQFGQVTKRGKNRRGSSASASTSRPSPRKMMRPVSPGTAIISTSSMPLPFPTKEDLASFFEYFVPTPHSYPFRVLFGNIDDEIPSTA